VIPLDGEIVEDLVRPVGGAVGELTGDEIALLLETLCFHAVAEPGVSFGLVHMEIWIIIWGYGRGRRFLAENLGWEYRF
jgi:hypothetical protein